MLKEELSSRIPYRKKKREQECGEELGVLCQNIRGMAQQPALERRRPGGTILCVAEMGSSASNCSDRGSLSWNQRCDIGVEDDVQSRIVTRSEQRDEGCFAQQVDSRF